MTAWADGLNFYLAKHPEVKPRVITKFEPWMALSFTEGSIGGDIETINLERLQSFYGSEPRSPNWKNPNHPEPSERFKRNCHCSEKYDRRKRFAVIQSAHIVFLSFGITGYQR